MRIMYGASESDGFMIIYHVEPLHWVGYTEKMGAEKYDALYSFVNKTFIENQVFPSPNINRLFIDSGAFSAFTRGVEINLDEYCEWLRAHEKRITSYAALDVIRNWRGSRTNLDRMLSYGLNPIPVFHAQSPMEELRRLCKEHDYIGLGGIADDVKRRRQLLTTWLDSCFSIIRDYWPIKVHGFGITMLSALTRYPFYSVDSSSVTYAMKMGLIITFTGSSIRQKTYNEIVKSGKGVDLQPHCIDNPDEEKSRYKKRIARAYNEYRKAEKYITDLWKLRGISWD